MTPRADHRIYTGTDHRLRLLGLQDQSGTYQDGATVEATMFDSDGTEVSGQTWPTSMTSIKGSGSITAVSTSDDSVTVAGDETEYIYDGDRVVISGSTGNDGTYTVKDVELTDGGDTVVTMEGDIDDATVDGTLEWGHGSYQATLEDDIDTTAGFYYDVKIDVDAGNDVLADFWLTCEARKRTLS